MNQSTGFSKLSRKDRFRTIGTSDTYDINPSESYQNNENRRRNGSIRKSVSKGKKDQLKIWESRRHNKSLSSVFVCSREREGTPKIKVRRLMSSTHNDKGLRVRTDYSQNLGPYSLKKIVGELKKNVVSEADFRLDGFKVLKMVYESEKEMFFTVKMKGSQQGKKYTLVRVKDGKAKGYEKESRVCGEICRGMAKKERKMFVNISHVWKEKKVWLVAMDNVLSPHEFNDDFYLFLTLFKNNPQLINLFIQQVASAVFALSKTGRAHGHLSLSSIYFPVFKGFLKADGPIKLGGLAKSVNLRNKQELMKMPVSYHTPPEILNFMLFEEAEQFDREYLEQLDSLREGWQVDVWSLGIMVLQLLNGGPLTGADSACSTLISLQHELLIRYSYLFEKLPPSTHLALSSMLSFNPESRPHPLQVIQAMQTLH